MKVFVFLTWVFSDFEDLPNLVGSPSPDRAASDGERAPGGGATNRGWSGTPESPTVRQSPDMPFGEIARYGRRAGRNVRRSGFASAGAIAQAAG